MACDPETRPATGTADQPRRRIRFQVPSTVYLTWNNRPISVLIRPSA